MTMTMMMRGKMSYSVSCRGVDVLARMCFMSFMTLLLSGDIMNGWRLGSFFLEARLLL